MVPLVKTVALYELLCRGLSRSPHQLVFLWLLMRLFRLQLIVAGFPMDLMLVKMLHDTAMGEMF